MKASSSFSPDQKNECGEKLKSLSSLFSLLVLDPLSIISFMITLNRSPSELIEKVLRDEQDLDLRLHFLLSFLLISNSLVLDLDPGLALSSPAVSKDPTKFRSESPSPTSFGDHSRPSSPTKLFFFFSFISFLRRKRHQPPETPQTPTPHRCRATKKDCPSTSGKEKTNPRRNPRNPRRWFHKPN